MASPSTPGALLSSSECEKYITGPIQSQIPHYIHRDEHEHATECQTCLPYVRDDTMATFRGSFLDATASTSDRIKFIDNGSTSEMSRSPINTSLNQSDTYTYLLDRESLALVMVTTHKYTDLCILSHS